MISLDCGLQPRLYCYKVLNASGSWTTNLIFFPLHINFFLQRRYSYDWSGRYPTSCGTSGTGKTPQPKPRRLTARPAESGTCSGNHIENYLLTETNNNFFIIISIV
ncbi:hypothetical protein FZC84_12345 [Rossellomorea vietnamensis]|uniref:Uncharacterized protein n=1 Tax=Rossellomorea vietnamensis TaxID=218284 RepID=A0A5D4MCU7_9BACI|nr:hypothetical protein FZC84_12345 [Rossellomorea vietnamensis]